MKTSTSRLHDGMGKAASRIPGFVKRLCSGLGAIALRAAIAPSFANDDSEVDLPAPARDSEFQQPPEEQVELGRMLLIDKELSGNRNISCATCQSPVVATVDGLSTNIGTGGRGLSVLRDAGAFNSLRAVVEHHLDPLGSLMSYDPSQIVMPPRPDLDALDLVAFNDPGITGAIANAIEIDPPAQALSEDDKDDLIDFLHALTDPSAGDLRRTVPTRVPSGLPLAEIN